MATSGNITLVRHLEKSRKNQSSFQGNLKMFKNKVARQNSKNSKGNLQALKRTPTAGGLP
jgi:hypothetical protein